MSKTRVIGKRSQVVEALASAIRRGELSPGDQLDGENELARRFDVSRGTIRQALDELKRRNLITTRSGIGSFVTFDGVALDQSIGWARALADAGTDVTTEVLSIEVSSWPGEPKAIGLDEDVDLKVEERSASTTERAPASDGEREHSALRSTAPTPTPEPTTSAVRIRRLRRLPDGTPISYENSLVPATGILADLPATGLKDGSLTATLAAAGLRADHGTQYLSVVRLDPDDADLLAQPPGASFLCTERTSYAADGRFVEHVVALLDPDHFRLALTFGDAAL